MIRNVIGKELRPDFLARFETVVALGNSETGGPPCAMAPLSDPP